MKKHFLGLFAAVALTGVVHGGSATITTPSFQWIARYEVRDASSNAYGSLKIEFNEKNTAALQKFDLSLVSLAPFASYDLTATIGTDPATVPVASFITDKKGKKKISYLELPTGGSGGNTNRVMPLVLQPLVALSNIGIVDTVSGLPVAGVDLNAPLVFEYKLKRNLTTVDPLSTVAGYIDLRANITGTNFKLKAERLQPSSVYFLALNGTPLATLATDTKGRLNVFGWPIGAPTLPNLETLELLDALNNPVLSTSF